MWFYVRYCLKLNTCSRCHHAMGLNISPTVCKANFINIWQCFVYMITVGMSLICMTEVDLQLTTYMFIFIYMNIIFYTKHGMKPAFKLALIAGNPAADEAIISWQTLDWVFHFSQLVGKIGPNTAIKKENVLCFHSLQCCALPCCSRAGLVWLETQCNACWILILIPSYNLSLSVCNKESTHLPLILVK